MPLDISMFRADRGGNPDLVRASQKRRFEKEEHVDAVIAADEAYRALLHEVEGLKSKMNAISKQVGAKKKAKEDASELIAETGTIKARIAALDKDVETARAAVDAALRVVGNLVHESVPVSSTEADNVVLKTWFPDGRAKTTACGKNRPHWDLLTMIDGVEYEKGTDVAGQRGYFLRGIGVRLSQAITMLATNHLCERDYTMLTTPLFMKKDAMAACAQLSQFDDELYKVTGGHEDYYLIATSEQPIAAYHRKDWIQPNELPRAYGGVSTCFRKEAGASGKDVRGIFRVHQFDKVEQFVVCAPEDSWAWHERIVKNAEDFYQALGIPYQLVNLVSSELNLAAAKKIDLECWFPGQNEFRELVSCSNCTDYQSRALETRFGFKKTGEKEKRYVHMLNGTLCALTRTICAILENHQRDDGIAVPKALQAYLGGLEFIPFVKSADGKPLKKKAEKSDGDNAPAKKDGEKEKEKEKETKEEAKEEAKK